jgi:hypothetical protein
VVNDGLAVQTVATAEASRSGGGEPRRRRQE